MKKVPLEVNKFDVLQYKDVMKHFNIVKDIKRNDIKFILTVFIQSLMSVVCLDAFLIIITKQSFWVYFSQNAPQKSHLDTIF